MYKVIGLRSSGFYGLALPAKTTLYSKLLNQVIESELFIPALIFEWIMLQMTYIRESQ